MARSDAAQPWRYRADAFRHRRDFGHRHRADGPGRNVVAEMSADVWRIESCKPAWHRDAAGQTQPSFDRHGRALYEVTLVCKGRSIRDYVCPGSSYRKTDDGFELSRFGRLVAAATDVARPKTQVHFGFLIGRAVRVEIVEDERGKERVTSYRSARV